MMIRTAGGPGSVSPLDFNERKQPLPKSAWIAIGVVAAAHVAVGVVLYNQRFELAAQPDAVEPPHTIITMMRPKPLETPKPTPPKPAAAANTAIHETPTPTTLTEPVAVVRGETPNPGPIISLTEPVKDPVPEAPPATTTPPPSVIVNPSWLRQPSADQMMRAYPDRALTAGVAGSVSLNCAVNANGSVGECVVTRETPEGYAFGRAAQSLSRYFRINPRTVNGNAVDARVAINLRFTVPRD